MSVRRARAALPAALLALLGACTSPNPNLYTIAPVPGPVQHGTPKTVLVRDVVLARYLDRTHIVRSSEDYRLAVEQNDWWGEPLPAMVGRVLVQELGQRLPGAVVYGSASPVGLAPAATVDLSLDRLDEDAAGHVLVQGLAGVTFAGSKVPLAKPFRFAVVPPAPDTAGEVAAISTGIGELADELAAALAAGPSRR
ncbi:MAG TPA: PqiC family protein [Acetobacteraceae bacterium]|nr:PqiC family protein [Acetobacteraceae bacterium]